MSCKEKEQTNCISNESYETDDLPLNIFEPFNETDEQDDDQNEAFELEPALVKHLV
ncbi:unnamed protein product, partial [Rotaria sp. Silwood2]